MPSASISRAVLFWLLIVHLTTPVLKSFRFSVERTFVALWGVKQTVNLSRYSKLLLPNASEKFCVTLCFSSVKFFWGIKGSQAEWCGRGTWNLLVHVNSQLVWLLSNGILKLPVEYIWVIKNTLSLSLSHTHTHTNTHNSLGSMVVLQVGKKIQCESYRSINEAPAKLSFAVRLEYRQIYIENKSCMVSWRYGNSLRVFNSISHE